VVGAAQRGGEDGQHQLLSSMTECGAIRRRALKGGLEDV
jgi:hypothetical protein